MNFISQVKKNPLICVALVVIILYAYLKLFRSEGARVRKLGGVKAAKDAEEGRKSVQNYMEGPRRKRNPMAIRKRQDAMGRKGKSQLRRRASIRPSNTGKEKVVGTNLF